MSATATAADFPQLLARALGVGEVEVLARRRSEYQKHTAVEVVTARLDGGACVDLFVKHLGSRRTPSPDQRRRDREARLYTGLLAGPGLPVPRCRGAAWDDEAQVGVLVLELLDAWPLHYHDLGAWFAAARRLGELHARFAGRAHDDVLLRIDARYLTAWAERAVVEVGRFYSVGLARRLERMVATWEHVAAPIAAQPSTLVHNDLSRKNVLVAVPGSPERLCFVDWETAGAGCGLLDLVHLRYGRLDEAADRRMLAEYAAACGLLPEGRELQELFTACELHRTAYRLARCARWGKSPAYVADRVAAAERMWAAL